MERKGIGLMALQETKVSTVTQYMVGDHVFVLSGGGDGAREHAGVGVVLSRDMRKMVRGIYPSRSRLPVFSLDTAP